MLELLFHPQGTRNYEEPASNVRSVVIKILNFQNVFTSKVTILKGT